MRMHSSCIRTRGFLKKAAKKSRLEDVEHLANPLYEYPRRILQSCIFVMPRWCWGGVIGSESRKPREDALNLN